MWREHYVNKIYLFDQRNGQVQINVNNVGKLRK